MNREELNTKLQRIIDKHRKEAFITCPETCWCWDVEDVILSLDYSLPPAEGAEEILQKYIRLEEGEQYPFPYVRPSCALKAMQEFAALTADKLAEERIREELIRYDDYRRGGERNYPYSARLVDEYLKSRKP